MNRRKSMHGMGNALKTALLLGSLSALILLAGQVLGGTTGLLLAGLLALGINGVSYFYSLLLRQARTAGDAGGASHPGAGTATARDHRRIGFAAGPANASGLH